MATSSRMLARPAVFVACQSGGRTQAQHSLGVVYFDDIRESSDQVRASLPGRGPQPIGAFRLGPGQVATVIVSFTAKAATSAGLLVALSGAVLAAPGPAYADLGPHASSPHGVFQVTNTNGVDEQFTIGGSNGCTVYHRWAASPA
jgi:hypothetical protein